MRELNQLINKYCTCGGSGPGESDCIACNIYHALKDLDNAQDKDGEPVIIDEKDQLRQELERLVGLWENASISNPWYTDNYITTMETLKKYLDFT